MDTDQVPPYDRMAQVYDRWMAHDGAPYEQWCDFIDAACRSHDTEVRTILEIGCGTGSMTRMLYQHGYEVTGVDTSEAMLEQARQKPALRPGWSTPACPSRKHLILAFTTPLSVASTL